MIFEINVKELVVSASVSRIVVSDSVNFWQAKVNLDSDFDGLNKKIVFYTDTVSKDVLIPESGIVTVPYEVLTPDSELRFTISGYKDDKVIHTKEMFSHVKIFSAGKFLGDNPEAYFPELWEQVMAKLNTQISADLTYNPESENPQSGIAVAEAIQPKIEWFKPNTIYKVGDIVVGDWYEEIGGPLYYYTVIAVCIKECMSDSSAGIINLSTDKSYWEVKFKFQSLISDKAVKDYDGNIIHTTYATKEETSALDNKINSLSSAGLKREVVDVLPDIAEADLNTVYMVGPNSDGTYEEKMVVKTKIGGIVMTDVPVKSLLMNNNDYTGERLGCICENAISKGYFENTDGSVTIKFYDTNYGQNINITFADYPIDIMGRVVTENDNYKFVIGYDGTQLNYICIYEHVRKWELIGSTSVDLTNYVTKEEMQNSMGDIETALDKLHEYAQKTYVTTETIGDIENALDEIIALQEAIINGE